MPLNITAQNVDNSSVNCILQTVPDKCPICNQFGQPDFRCASFTFPHPGKLLDAAFRCPASNCRSIYVASYILHSAAGQIIWALQKTSLNRFIESHAFPKNIQEVSPFFCLTYNQAQIAAENNLDQICGPGFRKALEFLVKDYLVVYVYKNDPEKQDEVKKLFLANAIEKHIDQDRIKQFAKRAVWIGNDEVHYTRKWEDKDISDLKSLILITVNHIDLTIESDRYLKEMPS